MACRKRSPLADQVDTVWNPCFRQPPLYCETQLYPRCFCAYYAHIERLISMRFGLMKGLCPTIDELFGGFVLKCVFGRTRHQGVKLPALYCRTRVDTEQVVGEHGRTAHGTACALAADGGT